MHTDSKSGSQIQRLPLFDWRAVVVRKLQTRTGQYLRSRFHVPPGHAEASASPRTWEIEEQAHAELQS